MQSLKIKITKKVAQILIMLDNFKKKKYINKFMSKLYLKGKYPFSIIKSMHQRVAMVDMNNLPVVKCRNPYQVFRDWLLEIIGKGVLVTCVYLALFGWKGWSVLVYLPFAFGLGWYTLIRMLHEISFAIRRE